MLDHELRLITGMLAAAGLRIGEDARDHALLAVYLAACPDTTAAVARLGRLASLAGLQPPDRQRLAVELGRAYPDEYGGLWRSPVPDRLPDTHLLRTLQRCPSDADAIRLVAELAAAADEQQAVGVLTALTRSMITPDAHRHYPRGLQRLRTATDRLIRSVPTSYVGPAVLLDPVVHQEAILAGITALSWLGGAKPAEPPPLPGSAAASLPRLESFAALSNASGSERDRLASEAGEKFRAAFHYAPTGMAILDAKGAFVDFNPALARVLNLRPGKLLGATLWDFIDPKDQPRMREDFLRMVEGKDRETSGTFRYRNGAGSDGWMHHSLAALAETGTYILHMIDVSVQKVTEADLSRKATHDPLTGLLNRSAVLAKLGAVLRRLRYEPGQVHVLFVDLDGFRWVNRTHGHAVGDRVLRAAAGRMKGALQPSDTIGRIGGDEFVVIIKRLPQDPPTEEIAHRLGQAVAAPVALDEGTVSVRASIGHASTHDPDLSPTRLLGSADADMTRQKQAAERESQQDAEYQMRMRRPSSP